MMQRQTEAIVLRTWPFHEADVLVSLFTREHGRVKGVARHAMKSRRRFGGALEPMTYVKATYAERRGVELVRLEAFEILWSPLRGEVDYARAAALQFVAEVLDEALPEGAQDDALFRLTMACVAQMQADGGVWMPVTYFGLWVTRLMGWMPELGVCAVCGAGLKGGAVWYSVMHDGLTCARCKRGGSVSLSAESVELVRRIFREPITAFVEEEWGRGRAADVRRFAVDMLERHLERKLMSARALARL